MSNPQVVEVDSLGLDYETEEALVEFYKEQNYGRYYPGNSWTYIKPEIKSKVNAALERAGVTIEQREYFHIVLRLR
jgi:hypothetical protein